MNLGRAISIAAQGFQNITDKGGQPSGYNGFALIHYPDCKKCIKKDTL